MDDANPLPTDVTECHRLLVAAYKQAMQLEQRAVSSEQQAAELSRVLDETAASHEELKATHQATLDELNALKRWVHGRRRERVMEGEGQQHLFELAPTIEPDNGETSEEATEEPCEEGMVRRRRRRRRELDLKSLPHHRHEEDLPEPEKVCDGCGRQKTRIGEDTTTILEHVPAKLEVHQYVRPKYACGHCKDGVSSPAPPARPIDRGIAGPGLVAQVVVSKFGDHLPLYRLEDIFVRHGVYLARSTLCDWVRAAAGLLQPLYTLMCEMVLKSSVMWTDDTPVKVLVGGEEGSRLGRFWAYITADNPYSVYDFTLNRSRDGPASFLESYRGYLHADAYGGYDAIYLGDESKIIEVACWAHARRKFFDARSSNPREAHQVLEWIWQLYDIEDRAGEFSVEARRALRSRECNPILDRIKAYLDELAIKALPKSALGKAVTYALNQWEALRRYTEDGRLTIDNNTSERTLRQQAIGRKNWLFLGSEDAGPRAAILCSVLASAKRHRIEPWTYVRELLIRLHADDTRLEEMLPDHWAAEHPEAILQHRLEESRGKATAKRDRRRHRRALAKHHNS